MASKLDPCEGYSWPPKVSGILNLMGSKCLPSSQSPGPKYMLPSLLGCDKHDPRSVFAKAPCVTLKGRNESKGCDMSPGPIYLPLPPDKGPSFTIKGRLNYRSTHEGPGPCHMVGPIKPCNPGCSFGTRFKEVTNARGPGPAAYNLPPTIGCHYVPNKTNAPCYSISSRHNLPDRSSGPGPGTYTIRSDCAYKHCPPKYSLSARVYPPEVGCVTPGPGAYCVQRVRNFTEAPHYSFGIKWCDKVNVDTKRRKQDNDDAPACPVVC